MPTVKELRDSLNKLIEKDENNADLDIFVLCQLSAGMEGSIAMNISSINRSSDLDNFEIIGLRVDKTFVELVEMSTKFIKHKQDEIKRGECEK
jgi:hypothetical protein